MFKRKIIASILTATMMLGILSGCSKVRKVDTDSMDKAADKMDATNIDRTKDIFDIDEDDLEDGVYITLDEDEIEVALEFWFGDDVYDQYDELLKELNRVPLVRVKYDIKDLQNANCYIRVEDESNIMVVAYIDCGDEVAPSETFERGLKVLEKVSKMIVRNARELDYYDDFKVDFEQMSKDELYFDEESQGYLKVCVTREDFEDFMDNDYEEICDDLNDLEIEHFESVLDDIDIDFDIAAGGLYFNGSNIVVTFIISDDEDFIADYETFMKTIGLKSPTTVELSDWTKKYLSIYFINIMEYLSRSYR